MAFDLITVAVFGLKNKEKLNEIIIPNCEHYEANTFEWYCYDNDDTLNDILIKINPQVILTYGEPKNYTKIWNVPLEIRKRWIALGIDQEISGDIIAMQIVNCYLANTLEKRFPNEPLVSVFTPTYKTGDKIQRPYKSLLEQTYKNWEWILYDDSPEEDNGKTYDELCELAKTDHRIKVFKGNRYSGKIGEVKKRCCGLANGEYLLELDHDDELTYDAILYVIDAAKRFPDAEFFYSDCCEIYENGQPYIYPDGWGLGYGSYRKEVYKGREIFTTNFPPINSKTIRHIVAAPNHLRCWKKSVYNEINYHNSEISVCDDYELLIRTFLKTRMVHIKKLGYIQYYNFNNDNTLGNTQKSRNKLIQLLVKLFRYKYNDQINKRFLELGLSDCGYQKNGFDFNKICTEKVNYEYE